eukprot:gene45692-46055_t
MCGASAAPPFVAAGWLYPGDDGRRGESGLNRRQRRAVLFLGRSDDEVRQLSLRYAEADALPTRRPPCGPSDSPAPPPLDSRVPSSADASDDDVPDDPGPAADPAPRGPPSAGTHGDGERSSTPGATADGTEPERGTDSPTTAGAGGTPLRPPPFGAGDRVSVQRKAPSDGGAAEWHTGVIHYIGFPGFRRGAGFEGEWVGVELDAPVGNHDGEVDGCAPAPPAPPPLPLPPLPCPWPAAPLCCAAPVAAVADAPQLNSADMVVESAG